MNQFVMIGCAWIIKLEPNFYLKDPDKKCFPFFGAEWYLPQKKQQNILSLFLTVKGQTIEQTQSGLDL